MSKMSEKPYSIRFDDSECDKILECQKMLGLRFSEAVRVIVDAYEPEYELKKEKNRMEEKLKYINEKLETIEQTKEQIKAEEYKTEQHDKITKNEEEEFETKLSKYSQPIWNSIIKKFSQDEELSFKAKDTDKIHKFIENKTKDLDTKLKENIRKTLKATTKRYIIKEEKG